MSAEQPLIPALISMDTGLSQTHGASVFPNAEGGYETLIYGTHYRSSATGAPLSELVFNNSGENSFALSGQWWFTLDFTEDGHILPLEIKPSYEIALASEVDSEHTSAYQADLSVTAKRSVRQVWTVEPGTAVRCILPVCIPANTG